MTQQKKELYEFGPFRLDPEKRLLLRNDEPVPLQMKAFETLLVLVRNSQQVVLKDEIMKAVWPDTFVEESNLSQNIFVLRKTLGLNAAGEGQRYISTIPGRGYRFAEPVRVVSEQDALVLQRRSRTHVLIEENISQPSTAVATVPQSAPVSTARYTRMAAGIGAVIIVALTAYLARPEAPPPRVTGIRQITHVASLVHNTHLLTDGPRIYFRVWNGTRRELRSVSTEGGEVFPVQMPFPEMDIDDISPTGSEFLVENFADSAKPPGPYGSYSLWRVPVPTGSPRPTPIHTHEATWSPDGRAIAYTEDFQIFRANLDGTESRQIATTEDTPIYLRWSPDGEHVQFSAGDRKSTGYYLWQADLSTNTAHKLIPTLPASARPWGGGWTPDGKYYFYTAVTDGVRNVYAVREKSDFFHRSSHSPIQLTNGPFTFYLPLVSKDGKHLYVVADGLRGELIRYDSATRQFVPYANSMSADSIAYSPDGQWMAYVDFPEGVLVRSRLDGSDRRQLTFAPMHAFNPQWSPDGRQIAFHAVADAGALSKIYVISPNGGSPLPATPSSEDRQMYASWTADQRFLLFASSDPAQVYLTLHILDVKTKQVTALPGTDDLFLCQISPDGRSVIAVNRDTRDLILYDMATHTTRHIADHGDYPQWSRDGKFVYFNNDYFSPQGRLGGVNRWNAQTNSIETLLKYPDFRLTGIYGVDYSITPDGSIVLVKDTTTRDLYALDLELP